MVAGQFVEADGRFAAFVQAHPDDPLTVHARLYRGRIALDRGDAAAAAEEIDKERGVIVEEWRTGLGAGDRIFDEQMAVLFRGSKYAERRTIGDMDIIQNHDHDTIRRYYRDWYRPDLQAVIDAWPDRACVPIAEPCGFDVIDAAVAPHDPQTVGNGPALQQPRHGNQVLGAVQRDHRELAARVPGDSL